MLVKVIILWSYLTMLTADQKRTGVLIVRNVEDNHITTVYNPKIYVIKGDTMITFDSVFVKPKFIKPKVMLSAR